MCVYISLSLSIYIYNVLGELCEERLPVGVAARKRDAAGEQRALEHNTTINNDNNDNNTNTTNNTNNMSHTNDNNDIYIYCDDMS